MRAGALSSIAMLLLLAAAPAAAEPLPIGYVELQDDPRYDAGRMASRIPGQPWGRPFAGAEVAAGEVRFPLSTRDIALEFRREALPDADDLGTALDRLAANGTRLVLLDLPGELVQRAARAARENGQVLFNVSAGDNALRGRACDRRVFHLAASDHIRMDGLAQYLVDRRWRRVLILEGPRPRDRAHADAFREAADRFGLEITDTRSFVRGQNPRQREANNVDLLTRGGDFDVIFVADMNGEFARTVPYRSRTPRPVVGSAGLVPVRWQWNWERHGAVQLNNRFERHADRRMTGADWSAWIGVKAIAEAAMRGAGTDAAAIARYLRGDDLVLDGFQGYRLSFRPWNQQLRMPVFLSSPDWVVARAPFEGFLHPDNDLDSLGRTEQESACTFEAGTTDEHE